MDKISFYSQVLGKAVIMGVVYAVFSLLLPLYLLLSLLSFLAGAHPGEENSDAKATLK